MESQLIHTTTDNSSWKILIIDIDEEDYIRTREMLLEAKGTKYTTVWASTYEAGRREIFSNHYHAVLVDYQLGANTGLEIIHEAVYHNYPSPLILFTGLESYETDLEAMQAGASLYLTKREANSILLERAIRYAIQFKKKEFALIDSESKGTSQSHRIKCCPGRCSSSCLDHAR